MGENPDYRIVIILKAPLRTPLQIYLYIPSGLLLECALGVELLLVADELGTFATTPLN